MATDKQKIKAIIITAVAIFAVCFFAAVSLLVSANYNKVFNMPSQDGAVKDLNNFLLSERGGFSLTGDWELFYNEWIVTDNIDTEPDFVINIHERWTGKTINGQKLKRTGYASYRLTIKNIEQGIKVDVMLDSSVPYRAYINGQLNSYSGKMSKTTLPKTDNGRCESIPYLVADDQPIVVIVEISYNNSGGLWYEPWIYSEDHGIERANQNFTTIVVYTIGGMIFAFIIFSILLSVGDKKNKNPSLILLVVSLALHLFSAPEFKWQFAWLIDFNFLIFRLMAFPNACLTLFSLLMLVVSTRTVKIKKSALSGFASVAIIALALFYFLAGTQLQIISVIVGLLPFVYFLYKLAYNALKKTPHCRSYFGILFMLISLFLLSALDQTGVLCFNLSPLTSLSLLIIMGIISLVAYKKIKNNANEALKAVDLEMQNTLLEREIDGIRQQALQAQIKPHFIFNALSSIQALYAENNKAGSDALAQFASHLRQNVDSSHNDTILFTQEINNIMNYVALENLRLDKKLTLLFDIEYADFEMPALSLQPFVENAIKYAQTQNKEDGYIRITSELQGDKIVVCVIDNGIGFDLNSIRPNAVGIKNCEARLKIILGAETDIQSTIGIGTTVAIKIPHKDKKE